MSFSPPDSFVEYSLFRSVPHFLNCSFVLLMSSFLCSLYILEISPFFDVELVKIFSQSIGFCIVFLTVSFALWKLLSFRKSHLLIVALSVCAAEI